MEEESKKYKCDACDKQTKQLNLNRDTHKWECNDCFFKRNKDSLQEK